MINQLLVEYIICGIAPALNEEGLIKFFNKSLKKKISLLLKAHSIKKIKIEEFDGRIETHTYRAATVEELERGIISDFLVILTNKSAQETIYLSRAEPEIRKMGSVYQCAFRGALV